jgi:manganese transport protein
MLSDTCRSVCFLAELGLADVNGGKLMRGWWEPTLPSGSLLTCVGIFGSVVMPHNLFLHSALVQSRRVRPSYRRVAEANMYNVVETGVALTGSFLINLAVLGVAAAAFLGEDASNVGLEKVPKLLKHVLGNSAAPILFALALLASGLSSSVTGTYAGMVLLVCRHVNACTFALGLWVRFGERCLLSR